MRNLVWMLAAVTLGAACKSGEPQPSSRQRQTGTALASPGQDAEELSLPLAKVGDVTITLGDFRDRMSRQSPHVRARYTSLEQKKQFLDALVRFEILAKEAYKRGLDKDAHVVSAMKQSMIEQLMRDELDSTVTADKIQDAELRAYYDAHVDEFFEPETVRASAIILKNLAHAERVALEARGEAGKTNKGFRDLVTKYTTDQETKLRGGDLRYFVITTSDLPTPVAKAAFALASVGDVSDAVDGGDGTFYVLKQTGRRRAGTTPFEDAKQQIRNKLFRNRRLAAQNAFVEGLRAKAKIEIHDGNLAKVHIGGAETAAGGTAPTVGQPVP